MRSRNLTKAKIISAALVVVGGVFVSRAQAGSWNDHATRLATLAKQIQGKEEEIQKLLAEKQKTTDRKRLAEIVMALGQAHGRLEELSKQYEDERRHVRFQHPERNDELERVYVCHRVRTLNEMESEFGLDGRLDRLKARILKTFPIEEEKKTKNESVPMREPASQPRDEDAPEKIHLKK